MATDAKKKVKKNNPVLDMTLTPQYKDAMLFNMTPEQYGLADMFNAIPNNLAEMFNAIPNQSTPYQYQQERLSPSANQQQNFIQDLLGAGKAVGDVMAPYTEAGEPTPYLQLIRAAAAGYAPDYSKILESDITRKHENIKLGQQLLNQLQLKGLEQQIASQKQQEQQQFELGKQGQQQQFDVIKQLNQQEFTTQERKAGEKFKAQEAEADRNLKLEISNQINELRKEQIDYLNRLRNALGAPKAVADAVYNVWENFDKTDTLTKQYKQTLGFVNRAKSLIDSNNPIAKNAITTIMARASSEVGNLSKSDREGLGGSEALIDKLKQIQQSLISGTLTEKNKVYLKDFISRLEQSAIDGIEQRSSYYKQVANNRTSGLWSDYVNGVFSVKNIPTEKDLYEQKILEQKISTPSVTIKEIKTSTGYKPTNVRVKQ